MLSRRQAQACTCSGIVSLSSSSRALALPFPCCCDLPLCFHYLTQVSLSLSPRLACRPPVSPSSLSLSLSLSLSCFLVAVWSHKERVSGRVQPLSPDAPFLTRCRLMSRTFVCEKASEREGKRERQPLPVCVRAIRELVSRLVRRSFASSLPFLPFSRSSLSPSLALLRKGTRRQFLSLPLLSLSRHSERARASHLLVDVTRRRRATRAKQSASPRHTAFQYPSPSLLLLCLNIRFTHIHTQTRFGARVGVSWLSLFALSLV